MSTQGFLSETVSLFVDNLPNTIHWKGLWQIVGRCGEVLSVYIPKKRSRAGSRFGFVKVGNKVEAERVKERLKGLIVYGSRISVSFAKYSLKVQKDKGEIKVQRLRGNSILLTIEDEDLFIMLEDLQWSYLKEIFMDVLLWTESICHKEIVVWLEIDGLPLHYWNVVTLERLVGLWGRFEAFGENVSHHLDCEKVNMLIFTSTEARIDEVVDVVVENKKFDVRVLELRMVDHSLVNLSKSEFLKKKEIEDEKVGVEVGADKEVVSTANLDVVPSKAFESGSSDDKKGSFLSGGGFFVVACSVDSIGDRRKVSVGKTIEVGFGIDEGRESVGFQISDNSNHVGLQGLDIDGVEIKDVDSKVVKPIIDGVLKMEDKVLDGASVVGSPEIGLSRGLGLQAKDLMDSRRDILVASGGSVLGKCLSKAERRRRERALKSSKVKKSDLLSSELSGRSLSDSDLKKRWVAAYVEAEETLSVAKMLGIKFDGP
ncbi:hypothetical protein F3Y22_tig00110114pilonHSYRG00633 [Hibiscus syriacus]|uniref:RRM domain-containing protein n=1 Tax=Hibiscus syriacus TaxID=106335 RepID=A0A6A3BP63_HIBSY|nr:hypothetical protein F3Y22_tig00110114pilonHSYRG00633 [Hibiscus syriacus]